MSYWLSWAVVGFGAALTLVGTFLVDRNAQREISLSQLETAQLKERLAWRILTAGQIATIRIVLLQAAHPVTIIHVAHDPETLYLAKQLADLFRSSGWIVRDEEHTYGGEIVFGFLVPGPENGAVVAVRQALTSAGIPFSAAAPPEATMELTPDGAEAPAGSAQIVVGTKRPPDIPD